MVLPYFHVIKIEGIGTIRASKAISVKKLMFNFLVGIKKHAKTSA